MTGGEVMANYEKELEKKDAVDKEVLDEKYDQYYDDNYADDVDFGEVAGCSAKKAIIVASIAAVAITAVLVFIKILTGLCDADQEN